MSDDGWPAVSVIMPLRDERQTLSAAVRSALEQDYPGRLEVVVAVAPSSDGTAGAAAALADADPRVRVVANPAGGTAAGLNAAVAAASGAVLARVDGHARLPAGYLRRAVALLGETGADNVGGVQEAVGDTPFEHAVARAMSSRFGVGDARFHYGGAPGPTDTVYLGVFRRAAVERVGGFDETLERNQDYELNYRLRANGGLVYLHPDLRVRYRPRGSLRALARQYYDYGRWKREVLRRHPRSLRWRQLVAPLTVAGLLLGTAAGARGRPAGWLLPGGYAAALLTAAATQAPDVPRRSALLLPLVYATMHLAWGAGFLVGVRPARRSPAAPPPPSAPVG